LTAGFSSALKRENTMQTEIKKATMWTSRISDTVLITFAGEKKNGQVGRSGVFAFAAGLESWREADPALTVAVNVPAGREVIEIDTDGAVEFWRTAIERVCKEQGIDFDERTMVVR
jgi:hypothetical protein